jgi:DNA repair protein RadC
MRARILDKGADSLTELELLEVLLYAGNARRDTKPLAKRLMAKFKSLSGVLRADHDSLRTVDDMGDAYIATIKLIESVAMHLAYSRIQNQPILTNWVQVQEYCINRLAHQPIEHFCYPMPR